jgi:hypothetical protein
MFEREATLFRFQLSYFERAVEGIGDDRLTEIPVEGLKPPAWLLGHLAIANDYTLDLLGAPRACPVRWHRNFGPGSSPLDLRGALPTVAELVDGFERGHRAVLQALPTATPEAMAEPNPLPMPFLKENLPTAGDLVAHLLTTHVSYHMGQLSTWRRAAGLPQVF